MNCVLADIWHLATANWQLVTGVDNWQAGQDRQTDRQLDSRSVRRNNKYNKKK